MPDTAEKPDYSLVANALIEHGMVYEKQRVAGLTAKFLTAIQQENDGAQLIDNMFERLEKQGDKNFRFNSREIKILTKMIHAIVPVPKEERGGIIRRKFLFGGAMAATGVMLGAARYKVQPRNKDWRPAQDPEDVMKAADDLVKGDVSTSTPTWTEAFQSGLATAAGAASGFSFGMAIKSIMDAYYIHRTGYTAIEQLKDKKHGDIKAVISSLYEKLNERVVARAREAAASKEAAPI